MLGEPPRPRAHHGAGGASPPRQRDDAGQPPLPRAQDGAGGASLPSQRDGAGQPPLPRAGEGGGEGGGLGEFALIAKYFARPTGERQGIGDDCALIDVGSQTLAITSDMLLEGVHFLPDADPAALGHKALAVNLSDLAAAGARPRCFLLDLALPRADETWLAAFSRGLFALAQEHGCALIGGDTTRAPSGPSAAGVITIAITAIGEVDRDRYCGRAGARPGDDIWITGSTGEAALALAYRRGQRDLAEPARAACLQRMDRPVPRIALGRALHGIATATVDVSDGLLGDLGHILERSGAGAALFWSAIPRAAVFATVPRQEQYQCVLAGGDDYEIVFTAAPADRDRVARLCGDGVGVSRIGQIQDTPGLRVHDGADTTAPVIDSRLQSFDHFAPAAPRA